MDRSKTGFTRLKDALPAVPSNWTPPNASDAVISELPACPDCRGLGWVRRDVDWGHPEFGKPRPCRCTLDALELTRRGRFATYARLPDGASKQTFLTFNVTCNPDAYRAVTEWAEGHAVEPWVYLSGGSGTGKTHLAYAAAWELIERGELVVYQNVPDMLSAFRATLGKSRAYERTGSGDPPPSFDDVFSFIRDAPWLILDDLGAESDTSWVDDQLYQILNRRYAERRPLLVTSNLLPEQLPRRIGSRLTDAGLCAEIDTGDEDQRPRRGIKDA
jgi:DNA replication protein DnaC